MECPGLETETSADGFGHGSRLKRRGEGKYRNVRGKTTATKGTDVEEGRAKFHAPFVYQMPFIHTAKGDIVAEHLGVRNTFPLLRRKVFQINADD
jgi:hypothetical protein